MGPRDLRCKLCTTIQTLGVGPYWAKGCEARDCGTRAEMALRQLEAQKL